MTTSRTTNLGRALCLGGAAVGAIGLTGWLTGVEAMVTIVPGQPPMMPNTAVAPLLLGTAGAVRVCKAFASVARSLSVLLAIIVLFIGLLTLAEYALDLPFSIDQLVVRIEAGPYPGRPSPPTALALVFLAASILLWNWRPAEWLTPLAGLIGFTALLGQAFGAGALYRLIPTPIIGVAVHTALGLLLISAGLLLERPGSRLARIARSPNPGDIMLRQLALAFILMSVAIGASGALLFGILGGENAAVIAASLTVIGIVVGLSLLAVTARQLNRAHEALEQGRRSASALIEQASEGIFVSDLEGRFVDVNSVGCRMAGYSREEILRKTIADLIPPDDLARLRSHRAQLLEGYTDVGEWALRRKDGSYLPVEVSAKILPDGRWLAFSRDIGERKRAEEALRESEERLRRVSDNADVGLTRCTRDWYYLSANPAYAEIAGKPLDQIVGRPIVEVMGAEAAETIRPYVERVLRGEHITYEAQVPFSGVGQRYLQVSYTPDVNAAGEIVGWVACITDITARKRAEDALRLAQERLDLAFKGADLATWDWNVKTGEVIFNSRWAEMRGFPPEEISSSVDSWSKGVHRDDWPIVQNRVRDCFEGKNPEFECEYRVATKSGDWIWILDRGKVFERDANGQPVRMVGTELDVTARRRAEEAIRLSEAKFSGIVSISADAIISIDENQKITLFNEGAEKIFGRSSADVIGSPLDILLPERLRAMHARHIASFASGSDTARRMGARNAEIVGVRSSGEEFPADAAISKIVIGGKPILTVALRDITEQKRDERERRILSELGDAVTGTLEFEQRLMNIAQVLVRELAEVCIVDVIDDDGSLRRAKVACRDKNKEWLCDVLMRQPPGDTRARMAKPDIESGKPLVIRNVTPDVIGSWARGQEHRAALEAAGIQSAIVVPLVARGKALGFVFLLSLSRPFLEADLRIAEAVTHRAALVLDNARLFAAARRAIRARDDMLGVVAHDLRNPLAGIFALAAVLQRTGTEREIGDEIAHAAGRMGRLIRDLVDATLLEAGSFTIKQERVPTRDVLSEVLDSQTPLASSASLELQLDAAHDLPDIWADHDRLLQVFENLVGNAIKFTKPGGRITLGARAGAGEVLFSVADTGCGIESDQLPRVFDRFWQAPEAKRKGAGLGLPIVKGIVEAHGGRIWVQSSPGQGSTFFFTIPTVDAPRRCSDTTVRVAS